MALKEQRGIKTVEVAGRVLQAIANQSKSLSLSELAAACDLPASQVYTYLVSLDRIGLTKRDLITQNFEPGHLSLRMGIDASLSNPHINKVFAPLDRLCEIEKMNCFICVWSNNGPVVIRYREWAEVMDISFTLGSFLSLSHTSTGMLFAAYLQPSKVDNLIKNSKFTDESWSKVQSREYQSALVDIRKRGISKLVGTPTPSVTSVAVPAFGHDGSLLYSVTVFNKVDALSNSNKERIAKKILEIVNS